MPNPKFPTFLPSPSPLLSFFSFLAVHFSLGLDESVYSMDELRRDYKEGLVLGIAFCLFAMPDLMADKEEEDHQRRRARELWATTSGEEGGDTVDGVGGGDDIRLGAAVTEKILEALEELTEV